MSAPAGSTSARADLAFLQAGLPELKTYLLSKELYWPLSARGIQLPRLTLGGLLLALERCRARGAAISALETRLEAERTRWRAAWEARASREFEARLTLWEHFWMDYQAAPDQHADAYPQEVRYRVMLHLLAGELPAPPASAPALAGLDARLKAALLPAGFLWEPEIQPSFPPGVYWYLYGKLKP